MRKVFALLIPFLLFSGCLSTGEKTSQEPHTPQIVEQKWENNSYQFWNLAPMSMGNRTVVSFNETGDVSITIEIEGAFHSPLLWERGYVNYTLINENETIFSHQLNEGSAHFEVFIANASNIVAAAKFQIPGSNVTSTYTPAAANMQPIRYCVIRFRLCVLLCLI